MYVALGEAEEGAGSVGLVRRGATRVKVTDLGGLN